VVNLNKNGQKTNLVHRLVAQYHQKNPDPERLTDVHHLDNNRSNNVEDNLLWVTHEANINLKTTSETDPSKICRYCGTISKEEMANDQT